jgi:basic membrane protein A
MPSTEVTALAGRALPTACLMRAQSIGSLLQVETAPAPSASVAVSDGTFKGGGQVFGLADDGVSYATSNPDLMSQDIVDQVESYKQKILDGTIEVPTEPAKS